MMGLIVWTCSMTLDVSFTTHRVEGVCGQNIDRNAVLRFVLLPGIFNTQTEIQAAGLG